MNPIRKVYCRAYQLVFRAALPVLPYRNPVILGSIVELRQLFKEKNISSVLLVTDSFLRSSGATEPLERLIGEAGVHCAVYDKVCPNPTVDNVEEARQVYLNENCQCLIAFGGGSSMDCAKAVGARVVFPKKQLGELKGLLKVHRKIPTLIAIPTTAGTGSEVTLAAVITDSREKHKYVMNDFNLIPSYAILDPHATYTLPPSLTATTGMDALTHAVEAYIGRSTTKETRAMATKAVKLIFDNIETAYREPENKAARENMLHAAHYAGIAFSKSYVGYVHAVAHSLGGRYNTPHGLANSVLLPIVLEIYGESAHKKLHELAIVAGVCDDGDTDRQAAEKFIREIKNMNSRMKIPEKLDMIQKEDVPEMAAYADKEANPLYPVPRLMDAEEIQKIYALASDWGSEK